MQNRNVRGVPSGKISEARSRETPDMQSGKTPASVQTVNKIRSSRSLLATLSHNHLPRGARQPTVEHHELKEKSLSFVCHNWKMDDNAR